MRELVGLLGWFMGAQGVLGIAGRVYRGEPWGVLQQWWDLPTPVYVALAVAGAALALYGETGKRGRAGAD
ncbi:hypothetical protein [Streptomyces thermolilacinus]|uniref:Uncharacterized protein n=1 Tax=Streptomyces thermolilacinus SPC6 TaxID=1306406 RepID=A0A1D3DRM3_9ACTN|nr:hypothetical protein [Streptomyces thermolilacinus]OEJ94980.1 hypothetical protein J116_011265 [Streptomyces thermolilacinus SPC6]